MPDDKVVQAAIYCRLAREDEVGIEEQLWVMREYAARNGYQNSTEYIDNGVNGLSMDRPELARMNADIRGGRINAVLVKNAARLFRNPCLFIDWLADVQSHGCLSVISAQEGNLEDVLRPLWQHDYSVGSTV